jgi:hypothetical protein
MKSLLRHISVLFAVNDRFPGDHVNFRSRWYTTVLAAVVLFSIAAPMSATVTRYTQTLDGGATVIVDNASGWSQSEAWNLVLAADRSTREECVYDPPDVKGLFKNGDRIFMNQNYIAWFDFTTADGVAFGPPYVNDWSRGGELAGFWTLDPATHSFKHFRTGPQGCWNWPANELIPGSASPYGEQNWWDAYSPALEHAINIRKLDGTGTTFMAFHYAPRSSNSGFQRLLDGWVDAGGSVHYKQSAKMTSSNIATDVYDDNDSTLSTASIQAEIEYICRPDDIYSYFTFKPSVNMQTDNIFIYVWTSYSGLDLDGTNCDAGGSGSQWPSASSVTGKPMYAQGMTQMKQGWNQSQYWAPSAIVPMVLGNPCRAPGESNSDIWLDRPVNGTWLRWGATSNFATSSPRFQLINLGTPDTGTGTRSDPRRLNMRSMVFAEERLDGTLGAGIIKDEDQDTDLVAGTWYEMMFTFRTNF